MSQKWSAQRDEPDPGGLGVNSRIGVPRSLHLQLEAVGVFAGLVLFGLIQIGEIARGYYALSFAMFLPCTARRGGTLAWLVMAFGMMLFLALRANARSMGFPLHTECLQELEILLCLGVYPSQLLQQWLFTPLNVRSVDYALVVVYTSYFFVPYMVLYVVWLVQPQQAFGLSVLLVSTLWVGVVGYVVFPATPPWMASQSGLPQVWRITALVGQSIDPDRYVEIYRHIGDPNPTAAIPSLHMAITFLVYLFTRGAGAWWRFLAGAYAALMGFALVYLGEHYVVDLVLGCLLAWAVWRYGSPHIDTIADAIGERAKAQSQELRGCSR
jgi:membrane-associated phospholipid phosphatase